VQIASGQWRLLPGFGTDKPCFRVPWSFPLKVR
jgi:hypothetical protein